MSDQQQEQSTLDDVWINRLAQRIGVLTAQNERLMVENEALQQQLQQRTEAPTLPDDFQSLEPNGEHQGVVA